MNIINAKTGKVISLGRVGDIDATTIRFDLSDYIGSYGDGVVTGIYTIHTYIVDVPSQEVSASHPYFDWVIHKEVTDNVGVGRFQYIFKNGDGITKVSPYYDTLVTESEYYDKDYSEDYRTWLDTLLTLTEELTRGKAQFEANVKASHDWAVGPAEVWDEPTAQHNAMHYSEIAQQSAEQATTEAAALYTLRAFENIVPFQETREFHVDKQRAADGAWEFTFDIPVNNPIAFVEWYESVEEMVSEWEVTTANPGQFVVIIGDQTSPDYGKVYCKLSSQDLSSETPGWMYLIGLAGASAIQGPQGYSVQSIAIADDGKMTWVLSDGTTHEIEGDNFYTWTSGQKEAIEGIRDLVNNYKQIALDASTEAQKWAIGSNESDKNNAKSYSESSAGSALKSESSAVESAASAILSESWAVGSTDTREDEATNNSKYFATKSQTHEEKAKSWAVGPSSTATAGTDENNAKYWSGIAESHKGDAADSAKLAESWAIGGTESRTGEDTNNAKYWAEQAQSFDGESNDNANLASQYARGKKLDGTAVISGDVGFHDNSFYYKEETKTLKEAADADADATAADRVQTGRDVQSTASYKEQTALDVLTTNANVTVTNNNVATTAHNVSSAQTAQSAAEAAKGLAETAKGLAITAKDEAISAKNTSVLNAELSREYAEGKKLDNSDVTIGEPGFNNNAKYYANDAKTSAINASTSESNAADSSELARKWANFGTVGDVPTSTNNAKYYSEQATTEKNRIANMTVSATRVDPGIGDIQPTKSTNPDGSLNIAFKIPQGIQGLKGDTGNGIKQIIHVSGSHAPGTYDIYRIDFTDTNKQSFEYQVWNGTDGLGSIESVNNVEPINGNITLNKESGGVALVEYFHIGDSSKSEDIHTLYIDF